jgi:lysine 6-dehydrogenase
MKIIVIGAGLIGNVIVRDLAALQEHLISIADIDQQKLAELAKDLDVNTIPTNLSDTKVIKKIIADQDMVVSAVPGFLGFNIFKSAIESGKNIVDISSMPENQLELDDLAKKHDVTAVVEMGVAPGISNMIVGYVDSLFDETESAEILVGGLPVKREWPFEYKITWSLRDTLEQNVIPAKLVENGKLIEKEALSEVELINFPKIGTLEAFNTDGLGSLIHTLKIPFMKEKTLRYPGYAEKMRMLRETDFFSDKAIDIQGVKVTPLDFTSELLTPHWTLKENESELIIMRVIVQGVKNNQKLRYTYDMLDYFDKKTMMTSMARNTAFPASIMAHLIAKKDFSKRGVFPGEYIGQDHRIYQTLIKELEKRNIFYKEDIKKI